MNVVEFAKNALHHAHYRHQRAMKHAELAYTRREIARLQKKEEVLRLIFKRRRRATDLDDLDKMVERMISSETTKIDL